MKIVLFYRMRFGLKSSPCCRESRVTEVRLVPTTDCLWRPFFGAFERAHLGVIYLAASGIGTALSAVFGCFRESFQVVIWCSRLRVCHDRRHDCFGPPEGNWRKRGTLRQAIGRSRGGLTTKIIVLVDALGNLVRFVLRPGQTHDLQGVKPLIEGISFGALLGDKAFDACWLRDELEVRAAFAVIPPKSNRKIQYEYDEVVYCWRHLVENYFAKVKEFRGIATRYDKTDSSYAANLNLVAAIIAAR